MLIVGNWKMNCIVAEAESLVEALKASNTNKNTVVFCPPFTLLSKIHEQLKGSHIKLGAQNCHEQEKGAYTGEISPVMLKDIGTEYVILGHSERRKYEGEKCETVNKKAVSAIKAGLKPIICIGETLEQRKAGETNKIITDQIENSIPKEYKDKIVIAYEPVWAIGTGITAKPEEIESAHKVIFDKTGLKALYGGSVTDANCAEICGIQNVSGVLVGGASIDAAKFAKIMNV